VAWRASYRYDPAAMNTILAIGTGAIARYLAIVGNDSPVTSLDLIWKIT
jgi:hypothetical protein